MDQAALRRNDPELAQYVETAYAGVSARQQREGYRG
jgi:hypothetical protein